MKKTEQKKRAKGIAEEIQLRIMSRVIAIFMVVILVVALMIANLSISAQKNDLQMASVAASYQLETFFEQYHAVVEQLAMNSDARTLLEETGSGSQITESPHYGMVFAHMKEVAAADSDNIQAVWVADVDANVLTQSDGYTSGSDFKITERAWYEAVETEGTILTEAYIDASTGNLILSAATPVYDSAGKNVIGVAGVDVALSHINELLPSYKIGDAGYVLLVTDEGNIIYHPKEENQQKSLAEIGVSDSVINAVEKQNDQEVTYTVDGDKKHGYVCQIGETNYTVISCLPSSEYYSSLTMCMIVIILLVAVGIIIVVLTIRNMARKLTKPIVALNDVAQELAEGNLDVSLDVSVNNEIGELAGSINKTV